MIWFLGLVRGGECLFQGNLQLKVWIVVFVLLFFRQVSSVVVVGLFWFLVSSMVFWWIGLYRLVGMIQVELLVILLFFEICDSVIKLSLVLLVVMNCCVCEMFLFCMKCVCRFGSMFSLFMILVVVVLQGVVFGLVMVRCLKLLVFRMLFLVLIRFGLVDYRISLLMVQVKWLLMMLWFFFFSWVGVLLLVVSSILKGVLLMIWVQNLLVVLNERIVLWLVFFLNWVVSCCIGVVKLVVIVICILLVGVCRVIVVVNVKNRVFFIG